MDAAYLPTNLSNELDGGAQVAAEGLLVNTSTSILLSSFLITFWLIYRLFIYPRFLSPLRHLPKAQGGYPILGHALARFKQPLAKDYSRFMREVPNEGIILFHDLFNTDHLLLTSAAALEEVLSKKGYMFEKPREVREFTSGILGGGLLTTEGDVHKRHRRWVTPSFTLRNTRLLAPLYLGRSVEMVNGIASEIGAQGQGKDSAGGVVDMNAWATRTTLDIMGTAGLGRKLKTLSGSRVAIQEAYTAAFTGTWRKTFLYGAIWCRLSWLIDWIPFRVDRQYSTATDYLRQFCQESIDENRQTKRDTGADSPDLLAKLIESNKFTDAELVDQLLSILAAGHETVAASFGWAVYLLASHPSIQTDLRAEILSCASPEDWITQNPEVATRLENITLLNAVCNETLRLYPSVPLTARVAAQDTSILDCPVPKGTPVMVAPGAINRAPHLWGPTAGQFRPERWIDAATGEVNKKGGAESVYAMLTFLHGPRNCLGSGYGRAKLSVMVAAFVAAFEFELEDPQEPILQNGRLATRPGDRNDRLMIRVRPVVR
ncbi:cytochrome P450 [Aspergillus steynii IBT 23096]|uniref:Cytochrome P450 n=1 Tax=Aspergillus steynii IBT 23096 TaxID=1392250 RepID=A0A2I2GEM0_9EURO|nr:cytochrome P450 [Aspergillus steynii IBT 23096]PLB51291.1 cytochrome P450 [Aspergillus steynii IBT 23096]